jgi:hypothetical protein
MNLFYSELYEELPAYSSILLITFINVFCLIIFFHWQKYFEQLKFKMSLIDIEKVKLITILFIGPE